MDYQFFVRIQRSLLSLAHFCHNLQIINLPGALLANCNIMAYQGHCRSRSMLVIHRHTCFNLYSSGTQFTFLLYCSCMLLNAYHLCNVYVTNKCCVASASGPKDRKTVLNFGKVINIISIKIGTTKHLCQYYHEIQQTLLNIYSKQCSLNSHQISLHKINNFYT